MHIVKGTSDETLTEKVAYLRYLIRVHDKSSVKDVDIDERFAAMTYWYQGQHGLSHWQSLDTLYSWAIQMYRKNVPDGPLKDWVTAKEIVKNKDRPENASFINCAVGIREQVAELAQAIFQKRHNRDTSCITTHNHETSQEVCDWILAERKVFKLYKLHKLRSAYAIGMAA